MDDQVLCQFRSEKKLRGEGVASYKALGMDIDTAFRMFMERTCMVKGLPFSAVLPAGRMSRLEAQKTIDALRSEAESLPKMTLDEINTEILAGRAERKRKG